MRKLLLIVSLSILQFDAASLERKADENLLRAIFVEKFTRFIQWPKSALDIDTADFTLCVFKDQLFYQSFKSIFVNLKIKKRKVVVDYLKGIENFDHCHIVYLSNASLNDLKKIVGISTSNGPLIIGEIKGFVEHGAHINLLEVDKKLRIEVNTYSMSNSGFKASSKLLKYARVVRKIEGD
ncbi:MAG: YfiR family protein [Pseudomonadota bacterium]